MRHRFIDLDGVRVFCREAGDPGAPAILLPHVWDFAKHAAHYDQALAKRI